MKKILSFFLAVVILASFFSITALADDSASYVVGNVTAKPGETVEVPIYLTNNATGIKNCSFIPTYDNSNLTLKSATKGSAWADGLAVTVLYMANNGSVMCVQGGNDITTSGEIIVLTFEINTNAPDGEYIIGLNPGPNGAWFVGPGSLVPTVTEGKITVAASGSTPTTLEVGEGKDITNSAGDTATVTGSVSSGTATLNVTADKACVVAYTTDNGATYTRVNATANASGGYDFAVSDYSDSMKFVVAMKGDADGDGIVGTSDYTAIARSLLLPTNARYQALDALNAITADADGDGVVGTSDYTAVARSLLLTTNARYAAIAW